MRKLIKKILKEDFGWAGDIPTEPEFTMDKIHVGAIYRTNPKRTDANFELEVIDISKNELQYRVNKSDDDHEPAGTIDTIGIRRVYNLLEPIGEYTTEPYWLYDKYQSKRLKEDFDWIGDVPVKTELKVGERVYIDGTSTEGNHNQHLWSDGGYIIIEIIHVDDETVEYQTVDTNLPDQEIGEIEETDMENAEDLVKTSYWRPVPENLNEQ